MTIKIECDRSIKRLNIEFDDGFETEVHNFDEPHKQKVHKPKKNEPKLNTSNDFETEVEQEIVEKPVIEEKERIPHVAEEMQNLSF